MDSLKKEAFEELKRREIERIKQAKELKQDAIVELKNRVLSEMEAEKKAKEDAITEKTLLKDIKGLVSDAISKLQSQNDKLIDLAKAELARPEESKGLIIALQTQTKDIIKALVDLETKEENVKWTLKTENIERGRDGRIVSMEVSAIQI